MKPNGTKRRPLTGRGSGWQTQERRQQAETDVESVEQAATAAGFVEATASVALDGDTHSLGDGCEGGHYPDFEPADPRVAALVTRTERAAKHRDLANTEVDYIVDILRDVHNAGCDRIADEVIAAALDGGAARVRREAQEAKRAADRKGRRP